MAEVKNGQFEFRPSPELGERAHSGKMVGYWKGFSKFDSNNLIKSIRFTGFPFPIFSNLKWIDWQLIARTGEILYSDEIDPRYWCACVEQTDFAPILFEDVIARIEAEGGSIGFKSGNGPTM